jgi:hypothetical protein
LLSSIRRRMTYANVAATLALVFSMSGGAIAATHYLINSKKQINPKVLNQLKGNAGATGPVGPAGPTGASGATGATGPAGSAVAYASVVINGPGNPTFAVDSGFSSVTEPDEGVYCLDPIYAGHTIIVSLDSVAADIAEVSPQKCPGGYQLETNVNLEGGQGFNVIVP